MRRKRQHHKERGSTGRAPRKGALIILLCLAAAAATGAASIVLDKRMNEKAISSDNYQLSGEHTGYVRGSVILDDHIYDYYHNYENYLFIGTDRSGNEAGEGTAYRNSMADYLMLLSIDKTADTYTMIELNRDTMTDVDVLYDNGDYADTIYMQLCTAHWYGPTKEAGCENQVKAVSTLLGGLRINGYFSVSMDDIPQLNHALGGVTVTLEDDFSHKDPKMVKGATLTLTDEQAAIYLQGRIDIGGGTNEERMARQHQYLTAFLDQGLGRISASPNYFYEIFDQVKSICTTNMTDKQFSRIASALTSKEYLGIKGIAGESELGYELGDDDIHAEYYLDEADLLQVMTDIYGLADSGRDAAGEDAEDETDESIYEGIGEDETDGWYEDETDEWLEDESESEWDLGEETEGLSESVAELAKS